MVQLRQDSKKLKKFLGRRNGETETDKLNKLAEQVAARYIRSPGWQVPGGLLWLTEKSEERGLGGRGLAQYKLPLPIAPLVASLMGSLRV